MPTSPIDAGKSLLFKPYIVPDHFFTHKIIFANSVPPLASRITMDTRPLKLKGHVKETEGVTSRDERHAM